MSETATVLFPFFPQLSVNRTYFASAYENLSSAFYIERIVEGKVFCDANQQPFSSIAASLFAKETRWLVTCVYMKWIFISKPFLNMLMIIFCLQVKKVRVPLKIAAASLLKNFAVATRRCDNAMKHLHDI